MLKRNPRKRKRRKRRTTDFKKVYKKEAKREMDETVLDSIGKSEYKNFNEYMIRTLCDNSYRMCLNMGENTLYTLKQRICQYLLRNMEMDAKFVMISSEVLSQQMAVTTRSVNRVLKQLREQGFIELEKGKISICDQQSLEDILRKD